MSGPVCACCGDSLDHPATHLTSKNSQADLCRACRLAPPAFTRAVAFGLYDCRMKAAIHALKYACLHPAAQGLGHLLAQAIAKLADVAPARMLVVPVPLHRSRQSQRGFNQARALARHALQSLAATHPAWQLKLADRTLVRLRLTESQAGLSPRQRRLNLRGAFTVSDPGAVEGKHILLIDDIMTTGATARAAALALRRAGAASVWVATLARAHRAFSTGAAFIRDERNDSYEDNDPGMTGNPPDAQVQQGSMHSSMNQPSF